MGELQQCAVYLVKQDGGLWRVQLEYDDGEVYLSTLEFSTEEEAMHAADIFIMEYSSNTSKLVH
jgi:uncharacterized protein YegP (UPF0339 family)